MPIDPLKEVAKIAVDSSHVIVDWFIGLVAAVIAALGTMWKLISSKMTRIEIDSYSLAELKKDLKEHIKDEGAVFTTLFDKHDHVLDRVNEIGRSVARIEGKLSNNHDWQDAKK